MQEPGERVAGALLGLMGRLKSALSQQSITLTNGILEETTPLHTLIDGIDATLIDLAAEELGEEELVRIASELSEETFAARQAESDTRELMRQGDPASIHRHSLKLGTTATEPGCACYENETGTNARVSPMPRSETATVRLAERAPPGSIIVVAPREIARDELRMARLEGYLHAEFPDLDFTLSQRASGAAAFRGGRCRSARGDGDCPSYAACSLAG